MKSTFFLIGFSMLLACKQANEPVKWIWYRHNKYQKTINMELKKKVLSFFMVRLILQVFLKLTLMFNLIKKNGL